MDNEKVSVLMSMYNCEATLEAATDSIIAQTYENWQLIMCDDCSTDGTLAIAKRYALKYPDKIILTSTASHSFAAAARNECLKYADGKYVAVMDADDISCPDRFEKQIAFLNSHPGIHLVGTAMRRFDASGDGKTVYAKEFPDKFDLKHAPCFNHATVMTYKYVFDKVGGYTACERTQRGEDYDLWFKFFYHSFKGANISEPLYRVRENMAAIKRRTARSRINICKTVLMGYKLLGFPKRWYIYPVLKLYKCLVPYKLIPFLRKLINK